MYQFFLTIVSYPGRMFGNRTWVDFKFSILLSYLSCSINYYSLLCVCVCVCVCVCLSVCLSVSLCVYIHWHYTEHFESHKTTCESQALDEGHYLISYLLPFCFKYGLKT